MQFCWSKCIVLKSRIMQKYFVYTVTPNTVSDVLSAAISQLRFHSFDHGFDHARVRTELQEF